MIRSVKKRFRFFVLQLSMLAPLTISACGPLLYSGLDQYGNYIPNTVEGLDKYLEFTPKQDVISNTLASTMANSINSANDEDRFYFLRSFVDVKENIKLPPAFTYQIKASIDSKNPNAVNVSFEAINQLDSSKLFKIIHLSGFKKSYQLSSDNYKTLYNNMLSDNGIEFLRSDNQSQNAGGASMTPKTTDPNQARYIRFTTVIMTKYNEMLFPKNPLANMYYAGFYNSGRKSFPPDQIMAQTQNWRDVELLAIKNATDLIYKKEIQPIQNLETNQVIDVGYTDAPFVRGVIQKLFFLASAYASNVSNNPWYKNASLKKVIENVMNDFAKNYYYSGQQQYVNWWFYEIGIPKDLAKLILTLSVTGEFTKEQFQTWSAGMRYFLPNPRYGGAAKTAILAYKPVTKKRLEFGANLVDNVRPILTLAALNQDVGGLDDSVLALYDNLFREFVTSGDGFYYDGSFVQHKNLPYIGSYGQVLFTGMANIYAYLQNTPLDLNNDKRFLNLYKYIELAVMPYMFEGSINDGLSGRSIVRAGIDDKANGLNILGALAIFEKGAPQPYKSRLRTFILKQVKNYSEAELKDLFAKTYQGASTSNFSPSFAKAILDLKKSSEQNTEQARNHEDWKFYETNYFNTNFEPGNDQANTSNLKNVPVGADLAKANNGLVFSKYQDRYVWNQEDFMFNINLTGRVIGFNEAALGENLESYYQSDGATLLHNKRNSLNYSNDYWTTIDATAVPGTSSFNAHKFDFIYNYRYPKTPEAQWTAAEKAMNTRFNSELLAKQTEIENKISLSTNSSFNNGIIFEKTGFVKSMVENYNRSLRTRKVYLMIDNQIVVVGNVSARSKDVNTTIANMMHDPLNKRTLSVERPSSNLFLFKTTTKTNSGNGTDTNSEVSTNAYRILNSNPGIYQKEAVEKYPIIANNNRKDKTLLKRTFEKLTVNHATNNTFAYSVMPNYTAANASSYNNVLKNLKIVVNNANYIVLSYDKMVNNKKTTTYYVASFFYEDKNQTAFETKLVDGTFPLKTQTKFDQNYENLKATGINLNPQSKVYFNEPTTLVLQTDDNFTNLKAVASNDWNEKGTQFQLSGNYSFGNQQDGLKGGTRLITNPNFVFPQVHNQPEVRLNSNGFLTTVTANNELGADNSYSHNSWMILKKIK